MEQSFVLQLPNRQIQDFYLCFCGYAKCEPLHSSGPGVRPNYVIHYVLEGAGDYKVDGQTFHLEAGQGFILEPNVLTFYQADKNRPWSYVWVGFSGPRAPEYLSYLGFNHNHLIFKSSESERIRNLVFQMLSSSKNSPKNEFYLHGLFFEFFSCLIDEDMPQQQEDLDHNRETTNRYLREAIAYIQQHFSEGLRVSDLADHVAVSRGYLYQIFNETLGMSPKQYLTNFCMTRATELLTLDDQPVEVVAKSCGYPNPVAFSALFRKRMGLSPTQYRTQVSSVSRERLKTELKSLQ
ncbi:MAG: AraC family transcriptional regulator [Hungatella sp.]|nr:AraC family transcriptional regulator [Hungatella sp.]